MGIHSKMALTLVPFAIFFMLGALHDYAVAKKKGSGWDGMFTIVLITWGVIFVHWVWS